MERTEVRLPNELKISLDDHCFKTKQSKNKFMNKAIEEKLQREKENAQWENKNQ